MRDDSHDSAVRLVDDFTRGLIGRRQFLARAGGLGLSLGAASALLAACSDDDEGDQPESSGPAQGARPGGTLVFARDQEPESGLNPIGAADNGSIYAIMQIFDQLVEVSTKPTPVAGLAESWERSQDGLEWTFSLRDAEFSNGMPVTAEDVKFTVERFGNPKVNAFYAALGASVRDAKVMDRKTVRVRLDRVDGAFLDNMSMFVSSVVPKRVVERVGEEKFAEAPIGSGPFMVANFVRGQRLELERNPNHWRPDRPYLDGVVLEFVPNSNTRVLRVRSGEADVAAEIPYNQVESLDGSGDLSVESAEVFKWDAIWFNTKEKPLDDRRVRQALNYATPKEGILESVLFGEADVANSIIARVKYWDEGVPVYPYDLDRARQLLRQSSAPDGFTLPLVIASGDPVERQTAEIVKEEWSKIGVDVQIAQQDIGTLITNWLEGKQTAATFPGNVLSSDTLSDDNLAFVFYDPEGGANSFGTGYDNPEVIRLINEASTSLSEDERGRKFSEAQRIAMEDAPAVPLFFTKTRTAVRDSVKGFQTFKTGWWPLWDVYMEE